MALYLRLMLNALQSSTSYRFHTFVTTINRMLSVLVQIALWTALYRSALMTDGGSGVSLHQMILYSITSVIITILVSNNNIYHVSHKVITGEIAINLVKPIGLFRATLFEQLGSKVFQALFEIVPILLMGLIFFDFRLPSLPYLALFGVMLILSFMIYYLITYALGLFSFWYFRVFHLDFALDSVIRFFSGSLIPLWFFSEVLQNVSKYLPFELIYFIPISVFLEQMSWDEVPFVLLRYLVYIVAFSLLIIGIWRLGIKKLVIQGG